MICYPVRVVCNNNVRADTGWRWAIPYPVTAPEIFVHRGKTGAEIIRDGAAGTTQIKYFGDF
jgi:hypothetical protein